MNPLPLLLLGGAGIMLLLRKRSPTASAVDPSGEGEWIVTPATVPVGFRRVLGSEVTTELIDKAKEILKSHGQEPIGTIVPFEASDGKQYLGIIEQHYHEPGGPLKPWGYHHGVSLFVEA